MSVCVSVYVVMEIKTRSFMCKASALSLSHSHETFCNTQKTSVWKYENMELCDDDDYEAM